MAYASRQYIPQAITVWKVPVEKKKVSAPGLLLLTFYEISKRSANLFHSSFFSSCYSTVLISNSQLVHISSEWLPPISIVRALYKTHRAAAEARDHFPRSRLVVYGAPGTIWKPGKPCVVKPQLPGSSGRGGSRWQEEISGFLVVSRFSPPFSVGLLGPLAGPSTRRSNSPRLCLARWSEREGERRASESGSRWS